MYAKSQVYENILVNLNKLKANTEKPAADLEEQEKEDAEEKDPIQKRADELLAEMTIEEAAYAG